MAFAVAKYVFRKIYTVIADLSNLVNSTDSLINSYGHKCPVNLRYWPHGYNYMFMDIYDRFLDSFEGSDERLRVYWSKEKPKCIKSEIKPHWEFSETPTIIAGNVFPMDMFNGAPLGELIWEISQRPSAVAGAKKIHYLRPEQFPSRYPSAQRPRAGLFFYKSERAKLRAYRHKELNGIGNAETVAAGIARAEAEIQRLENML